MSTFASGAVTVTFDADAADYEESREGRVAVVEIPGGDDFYVDRAGRRPLTWTVSMVLPNRTALGQLHSVVGQSGTLAIDTLDSHTATLMRISNPPPMVDGRVRASTEFLITT